MIEQATELAKADARGFGSFIDTRRAKLAARRVEVVHAGRSPVLDFLDAKFDALEDSISKVFGKGKGFGTFKEDKGGQEYGTDVCGGCGANEGKEGALLQCGKCKAQRYCSLECQRKYWKVHKRSCGIA